VHTKGACFFFIKMLAELYNHFYPANPGNSEQSVDRIKDDIVDHDSQSTEDLIQIWESNDPSVITSRMISASGEIRHSAYGTASFPSQSRTHPGEITPMEPMALVPTRPVGLAFALYDFGGDTGHDELNFSRGDWLLVTNNDGT
jgi:hypothetical protein